MHKRSNDDTEYDRNDYDRKSPVSAEVIKELDNAEYPIFENIPH